MSRHDTPPRTPKSPGAMSTTSSNGGKSGTRRKKKTVPPISLEEVFNQVSMVASSNINPPPARVVLTPRSAEVCLKLGINPEILKIRDIDSFWEAGIDPAVQRIRHEAYVQRRYDTMKQCRMERKRMAVAELESSTNINSVETMTPEMILEQQKQQNSTLIQVEMQRIANMQRRQQKELESMIQFEINRAKVAQDMEKRLQEQKKRDQLRKKQQEKRMKLMADERRLRELQKQAMEEAEEQNRVAKAKEMHEREREIAEMNARKLEEQRQKLKEEELERKQKHEEHKRQVEQYFAEEQMQLRQRLESMQYAEQKKQEAIMRKQQEHAENLRKRRAAIEKRIAQNMEMAAQIEEKKKNDFLQKQDHFERIRELHLIKQEQERDLKSQELELQEQRRRMILMQQRRDEEKKAEEMLQTFELQEEHVAIVQKEREKEHEIMKEKKVLRTQMKLENVQRVKRVGEYQRMGTLKKIEDTDKRVTTMLQQRNHLVNERKRAAAKTRLQKESIAKVMEEVRTNASKANKIIAQAMTGKVSLEKLVMPQEKKRSKSATNKRRRGNGSHASSTGELPDRKIPAENLGLGRETKSAGDFDAEFEKQMEGNDERIKYSKKQVPPEAAPMPYKSPYAPSDANTEYDDDHFDE